MDFLRKLLLFVGAVGAMIAIIPLMVWGGTGDWRRAVEALKSYLSIAFWAVVIFGGAGALAALLGWIDTR